MNKIKEYISFLLKAKTASGIHSPFVFEFYKHVLGNPEPFYKFQEIEAERKKLLASQESIEFTDLGTGKSGPRKIAAIARKSLASPRKGKLLFRMVEKYKQKRVLELGTNLGVSTEYLAAPSSETKVMSLDGCPGVLDVANRILGNLKLDNVSLQAGNFSDHIPRILAHEESPDFIYFDGNHTESATLEYFRLCLPKASEDSIFVFDDIRWSGGMIRAWNTIKSHPRVTLSLDLFETGIVFFHPRHHQEHFMLRF